MDSALQIIGLTGFTVLAVALAMALRKRINQDESSVTFRSKFGPTKIYEVKDEDGRAVRLLKVNGIIQSGTYTDDDYTDLVFEYMKGYDRAFKANRPLEKVCVLGCGGYDYPKHLVAMHPKLQITAVEIDPLITEAAKNFFFLDRLYEEFDLDKSGRLSLVESDALDFLETTPETFDAIFNDCFDGDLPPLHLSSGHFLSLVHKHLNPGGMYLTNIVASLEGKESKFLFEQVNLLKGIFSSVYVFPCDKDALDQADNVIVVATDEPLPEALGASAV